MKKTIELIFALCISAPFFVIGYLVAWAAKGAILGWRQQGK